MKEAHDELMEEQLVQAKIKIENLSNELEMHKKSSNERINDLYMKLNAYALSLQSLKVQIKKNIKTKKTTKNNEDAQNDSLYF